MKQIGSLVMIAISFSALFMYWKFREKSPFRFTYSGDFLHIHWHWFLPDSNFKNNRNYDCEDGDIIAFEGTRLFHDEKVDDDFFDE